MASGGPSLTKGVARPSRPDGACHLSRPRGTISTSPEADAAGYTVVARRYRPQRFEDVVGQDHVVQALRNAIRLHRVTHAYLFCGTRGVGKTSIARIFAKCLNCVRGPTDEPDGTCDICQAIAVGQDVDVIEIDGASNNGVEQVRELRQNAGLRPSRARFKIYYIDEVHMLSTGAFNALLKTLEEPPEHVKFFFATTEPNKIPVTVLSRCQRYDFAGISPEQIVATLSEICEREAVPADSDALAVIARRAGGSMRDAQSLLEQLLSFGGERLTVDLVQGQLGIASDERTLDLLDALSRREPAQALQLVDQTAMAGVQPTELLAGAIEFLRDTMMVAAGADVPMLAATPRQKPRLKAIADRWPLDTLLAALQVLAEYRGRLRGSPHGRVLVEIALLRVARLDNLAELGEVVSRLVALEGTAPAVAPLEKKKLSLADLAPKVEDAVALPAPLPATPEVKAEPFAVPTALPAALETEKPLEVGSEPPAVAQSWDLGQLAFAWPTWAATLAPEIAGKLTQFQPVAIEEPGLLVIEPPAGYNWLVDALDRPDLRTKVEAALRQWLQRPVELQMRRVAEAKAPSPGRHPGAIAKDDGLRDEPLIQFLVEKFEAKAVRVEVDDDPKTP